jgi:hypothetical protein
VLGDDLGVTKYFYAGGRLNFHNFPILKNAGARVFSSFEVAYYPSDSKSETIRNNLRGSIGMGVNLPLNDMISIALYHNFSNYGSKLGDIERSSYLNFTF